MPAKSKAQFKKMHMLYKQGKISKKTLDEFTKNVSYKSLPSKKKSNPGALSNKPFTHSYPTRSETRKRKARKS